MHTESKLAARDWYRLYVRGKFRVACVLFRRYLSSIPGCEIDPDHIFDLDAIRVFRCDDSSRHSFHFADNSRRRLTIHDDWACKLLRLPSKIYARKSLTVSFQLFGDEISGVSTRLSKFIGTRWPRRYEDLFSANLNRRNIFMLHE